MGGKERGETGEGCVEASDKRRNESGGEVRGFEREGGGQRERGGDR